MTEQTKKKPRTARRTQGVEVGSREANRQAAVILEVLAGQRAPVDAARALGVGPPRYYQLETRALRGLVQALEPRPKGKQSSPERRIAELERALESAHRECLRQQALVRAAQRSLGIKAASGVDAKRPPKGRAGKKKRRPAVRALRAAKMLAAAGENEDDAVQREGSADGGPSATEAPSDGACTTPSGARG